MKNTKRSMLISGLCLLLTAVMLMGSTFAWFTDSVTNTGNKIEAGTLNVDLLMDKAHNGNYVSIADETGAIFSSDKDGNGYNWEPGMTQVVYLAVQNNGSLALNYSFVLDVVDNGLVGSLEYAVLNGTKAVNMTQVKTWEAVVEKATADMPTTGAVGDVTAGETSFTPGRVLEAGETAYFAMAVHMKEEAGNPYQDGSVTIDVKLLAKQAMSETDGFGKDDYDKEAAFSAVSNDTFVESMEKGGVTAVDSSFVWDENITLNGNTASVLELNPETVVTVTKDGIFDLYGSSALTIRGEGTLEQNMESEIGYLVRAAGDSKVVIEGGTFIGGLTCIQAGGNAQVEIYGGHFEALEDWNETYWLLNLIDNSNASIKVYGGTFVNFDPSNSKTENPVANFVAEGYKVVSETQDNGDIWYTVVPE